MASQPQQPTRNAQIIGWIEDYLLNLVTVTPAIVRFTAVDIADHYGDPVVEVSQWLQIYRRLQATGQCEYRIGTTDRGAGSKWLILRFPGMTTAQERTGAELFTLHEILSLLRETIDPRLKNVTWEMIATFTDMPRRQRSRSMLDFEINVMTGFRSMLLAARQDISSIRPRHLRPVVVQTQGVLTQKIHQVGMALQALQVL